MPADTKCYLSRTEDAADAEVCAVRCEPIRSSQLIGGAFILGGIVLVNRK